MNVRLSQIFLALGFASSIFAQSELLRFHRDPNASFTFQEFIGDRIAACVTHWLLPTPEANPGMLEMFQLRDRKPVPNLVPWTGEFVGKYLISAIQIERLGHPELRPVISRVISQLIASQAEDGYLGPFPKQDRLLKHWDLWGHYHCMLALLMWHEQTGDPAALACTRRAADLVCATYLNTSRRMLDAGSDEMNLSIIHALGWLHRLTSQEKYLTMMREIEKDWERAGDFLRAGLAGTEFFETRRPRWESLHSLQGLLELHRITREEKYRAAFEHHWRSIARWDVRNSGGFSSGEQATGNPYSPTPIETCCSIAWMALSVDMLQLTGDSKIADELELATLNAWAGAQHPSGRWCTYNTPMDGMREASAHTIVFQSRHGTPELNCCSVNGPRGWGMLADWALLRSPEGLVLNWLGPGTFKSEGVTIRATGNYPSAPNIKINVASSSDDAFTLRLRIPHWASNSVVKINGENLPPPTPGRYLALKRNWRAQEIELNLAMPVRLQPGAREAAGKVSLYRGPLLLAWDQRFNPHDEETIPILEPADLAKLQTIDPPTTNFAPIALLRLNELTLCDFATAGATGARYVSWLKVTNAPPPPVVTRFPRDNSTLAPGQAVFRWTGSDRDVRYHLKIDSQPNLALTDRSALIEISSDRYQPNRWYHWQVLAENRHGQTAPAGPPARFRVNPNLSPVNESLEIPRVEIIRASLKTNNAEGTTVNGINERLLFPVGEWPEEAYSITLRFRLNQFPSNRLGQIVSAWAAPLDDPLRLVIDQGMLHGRIEAGSGYSTKGIPVELDRWYRVAAVRDGSRFTLWVDGRERGSATLPLFVSTSARDFALGGNPRYSGNEHLNVTLADLAFYPRALTPTEAAHWKDNLK